MSRQPLERYSDKRWASFDIALFQKDFYAAFDVFLDWMIPWIDSTKVVEPDYVVQLPIRVVESFRTADDLAAATFIDPSLRVGNEPNASYVLLKYFPGGAVPKSVMPDYSTMKDDNVTEDFVQLVKNFNSLKDAIFTRYYRGMKKVIASYADRERQLGWGLLVENGKYFPRDLAFAPSLAKEPPPPESFLNALRRYESLYGMSRLTLDLLMNLATPNIHRRVADDTEMLDILARSAFLDPIFQQALRDPRWPDNAKSAITNQVISVMLLSISMISGSLGVGASKPWRRHNKEAQARLLANGSTASTVAADLPVSYLLANLFKLRELAQKRKITSADPDYLFQIILSIMIMAVEKQHVLAWSWVAESKLTRTISDIYDQTQDSLRKDYKAKLDLESLQDKLCDHCGKAAKDGNNKLKRCSRCKTAWYCGSTCAAAAWKAGHKANCIAVPDVAEMTTVEELSKLGISGGAKAPEREPREGFVLTPGMPSAGKEAVGRK